MLRVCSADANPPATVSAVGSTLAHSATPLWTPSTLRWDTARSKLHTDTHTHTHHTGRCGRSSKSESDRRRMTTREDRPLGTPLVHAVVFLCCTLFLLQSGFPKAHISSQRTIILPVLCCEASTREKNSYWRSGRRREKMRDERKEKPGLPFSFFALLD